MITAQVIARQEAITFLEKPKSDWARLLTEQGISPSKYKTPRAARGAGGHVDLLNFGGYNTAGKLVVVMRVGMAPYQNKPVVAALGESLAPYTAYLMRLAGIGLSHDDLVGFVQSAITGLRPALLERGRNFRYLFSLDDPTERLVEGDGLLRCSHAVTGRVYVEAGALHAGMTKSGNHGGRYIEDGKIRSTYQNGQNITAQVAASGQRIIQEGAKHRFVWVLAPDHSLEYAAWRRVLPAWVHEPEWGAYGLGWIQPRLLVKRTYLGVSAKGQINDLVRMAVQSFGYLIGYGEERSGDEFGRRIQQVYSISTPQTQAVVNCLLA